METTSSQKKPTAPRRRPVRGRGFSLIELLTVIFIISLLIAILIPSLTSARNAAKKTSTKATLNAIKVALEAFKNDNERDFRATNGYPPSFAHPPIYQADFDPLKGEFPFLRGKPVVYGAHWLPATLMGVDSFGYVQRNSVPPDKRSKPWEWYKADPVTSKLLDRTPLYLDAGTLRLTATEDLPGSPNRSQMDRFFPNWGNEANPPDDFSMRQLPVIADAFGQPILYYAASAYAQPGALVEPVRNADPGTYRRGTPYYFHQDNSGFTGDDQYEGWSFGGTGEHAISKSGARNPDIADAVNIESLRDGKTFARFILDYNAYKSLTNVEANTPLKCVNPDSYILISAGVDGIYGSRDDVTNFPTGAD